MVYFQALEYQDQNSLNQNWGQKGSFVRIGNHSMIQLQMTPFIMSSNDLAGAPARVIA